MSARKNTTESYVSISYNADHPDAKSEFLSHQDRVGIRENPFVEIRETARTRERIERTLKTFTAPSSDVARTTS